MSLTLFSKNLLEGARLVTASEAAAAFPAARLYDRAKSLLWKATTGAAWTLDLDMGYPQTASALAIVNHNLHAYASAAIITDTPVAYWRLGEAYGGANAADSSGNGRTGTYVQPVMPGAPGLLLGDPNLALFVATGGYFSASLPSMSSWTLECWISPRTMANSSYLFSGQVNGTPYFRYDANGTVILSWQDSTVTSRIISSAAGVIAAGGIYHIVASVNGGTSASRIYINNILVATSDTWDTKTYAAQTWFIGAPLGGGGFFDGVLDEAAIYGTTLSTARVNSHYLYGRSLTTVNVAVGDTSPPGTTQSTTNTPAPADPLYTIFTPATRRYWRIYFTNPLTLSLGDGPYQAGEILLGVPNVLGNPSTTFARSPGVSEAQSGNVQVDESPGGFVWKVKKGAPRWSATYGWAFMSDADWTALLQAYAECSEGAKPFVLIDVDGTARWVEIVSTNLARKRYMTDRNDVELELREAL